MNEAVNKVFGAFTSVANGAAALGQGVQAGLNAFDQMQQQAQVQRDMWSRRDMPSQQYQCQTTMYQAPVYPWAQQTYTGYGFGQPGQTIGYPGISNPGYGFTIGGATFAGSFAAPSGFGSAYANSMMNGAWRY